MCYEASSESSMWWKSRVALASYVLNLFRIYKVIFISDKNVWHASLHFKQKIKHNMTILERLVRIFIFIFLLILNTIETHFCLNRITSSSFFCLIEIFWLGFSLKRKKGMTAFWTVFQKKMKMTADSLLAFRWTLKLEEECCLPFQLDLNLNKP